MPADPRIRIAAGEPIAAGQHVQCDETGTANAASPIAVDYLEAARKHVDTAHLSELERITFAAGELYGDALRDQLHRAIGALADHMSAAWADLSAGRRRRDDDLTHLHAAVEQWADDYRRIDRAYQEAADELLRRRNAYPDANLGAARTRELLGELLARLSTGTDTEGPEARTTVLAGVLLNACHSALGGLPDTILDYRTIDS